MRIYAVADIHGRDERLAIINSNIRHHNPDILVVAGDISNYVRPARVLAVLNALPVPVLLIRGNTDRRRLEQLIPAYPNLSALHLTSQVRHDINFVGCSGTTLLPFTSKIRFREHPVIHRLAPLLDEDSVLIVHPPPRGVRDEVFGRVHAGSPGIRTLIEAKRPRLVICGHIHERRGVTFLGATCVVNCSIGHSGGGTLIELAPSALPSVKML